MSAWAFFSLFAGAVCFFLGISVYYSNPKSHVNKVFVHLCLSIAYWAFTDFMVLQAESFETAHLWLKLGFIWPFTSAFLYDFSIVFTKHKSFLGSKFARYLNYVLAFVFSFLQLSTNLISDQLIFVNGFYSYTIPENPLFFWLSTTWLFALALLGTGILTQYCLKETGNKRNQATFVGIGFSLPILFSMLSEILPLLIPINIPSLSTLSTAFLCVFVWYAIWKYGLFTLTLSSASETIISTMPDSLVLINPVGEILTVNQSLIKLLGYTEDALDAKHVGMLFEENSGMRIRDMLIAQQEIMSYEATCKTCSGIRVPVNVSASMVRDKSGEFVGSVVVIRDVTEKKKMEHLLVKSEKMAALGQAATMVGHDLRNPLQSIQNAVYCIKRDLTKNSVETSRFGSSLRMIEIIEDSIAYSDNIVMDLKDFSTERKPELVPIDVNELVKDALNSIKLPETLDVLTELNSVPFVSVDKAMIKRTFVNILSNGLQAMPREGTFRISTGVSDGFVAVRFQDNGMGMSDETRKKLFTPFFTTKAQGMGMGLAICKKFVELNDGQINVESKQGKGSTFTILLPVSLQQITCVNQN